MFDNKTEDNTPTLKELDSTINHEPTLEELNEEMGRFGFADNATWTLIAEEELKYCWRNQYLPEAAALAAPPVGYQKLHQNQLRLESRILKRV